MSVTEILQKVKTAVYKNRIRIKEFFSDFDKLRCGNVSQSQFKSGLSMAGLVLSAEEMAHLVNEFAVDGQRVNYRLFCEEVEDVFGKSDLEKCPTLHVPGKPDGLVNGERFTLKPGTTLPGDAESKFEKIMEDLAYETKTKRIQVKPFFDDASRNQNSPLRVNHVSRDQFKQALKNHIAPDLSPEAVEIIMDKFQGEGRFNNMVNYVAFANNIDPSEAKYDPYSLKPLAA
mmetsp:Transcript_42091/g.51058  ORF Transcript_42091/g.51058 Transcript_42091/m.51058 type:complete len:230 (-) Transcript_42091:373-1062(-)|eukprot:CAMPEP_0197847936 /NCGR_PEP_ID=MMETSP1438-20131217/7541_1 /TAXON_ID=1461541 /ORGANISM="Pterosperma sp., Strain CCMP1384" /LENGTH=229 /DNA_ID=CAMNT_0043460017 /DNA_START=104 /DNA_END=793 /DNA_ORIENTATION=+